MKSSYLIAALAVAAAVILGLSFYTRLSQDSAPAVEAPGLPESIEPGQAAEPVRPASELEALEETPPSPAIDPPVPVLPPLNASDGFVRERLPDSLPSAWLEREDLLRRTAVVLENATRGEIPKRQLAFLAPDGPFPVLMVEEPGRERPRFFTDPAGYARYDRYLDMLEALPPEQLGTLLTDVTPLLTEALKELGSQAPVQGSLLGAIDQMLAVPVIRGDIELVQPKVLFEYADPSLENLSDLQKQVLRMGPDNVERLQSYLSVLRESLSR